MQQYFSLLSLHILTRDIAENDSIIVGINEMVVAIIKELEITYVS